MKIEKFQKALAGIVVDDLRNRISASEERGMEVGVLERVLDTTTDRVKLVFDENKSGRNPNGENEVCFSSRRMKNSVVLEAMDRLDQAAGFRYIDDDGNTQGISFAGDSVLDTSELVRDLLMSSNLLLRYGDNKLVEFASALALLAACEANYEIPEFFDGDVLGNDARTNIRFISYLIREKIKKPRGVSMIKEDFFVLKWLLGSKSFNRFWRHEKQKSSMKNIIVNVVNKVMMIMESNSKFRDGCVDAVEGVLHAADQSFCLGAARRPYADIMNVMQISEHEWCRRYLGYYRDLESKTSPTKFKKIIERALFNYPDPMSEYRHRLKVGEKSLSVDQDTVGENEDKLVESVSIRYFGSKLKRDICLANDGVIKNRIHALAAQCMAEVCLMGVFETDLEKMDETWSENFPVNFMKNRKMTCFTAPYMLASLLIRSGVFPNHILYCNVNLTEGGHVGGHGTLAIVNRDELIFLDINNSHQIVTVDIKQLMDLMVENGNTDDDCFDAMGLLYGKGRHVAKIRLPKSIVATLMMHQDFQIMPVTDGFAAEHLMHVGLSFRAEGKMDQARYALRRALRINSESPQILYYMGIIEFEEKNYDKAYRFFKKSLDCFPGFLAARFSLGELAMLKGNYSKARQHFRAVLSSDAIIYGGEHLVARAEKYINCKSDMGMCRSWRKDFEC